MTIWRRIMSMFNAERMERYRPLPSLEFPPPLLQDIRAGRAELKDKLKIPGTKGFTVATSGTLLASGLNLPDVPAGRHIARLCEPIAQSIEQDGVPLSIIAAFIAAVEHAASNDSPWKDPDDEDFEWNSETWDSFAQAVRAAVESLTFDSRTNTVVIADDVIDSGVTMGTVVPAVIRASLARQGRDVPNAEEYARMLTEAGRVDERHFTSLQIADVQVERMALLPANGRAWRAQTLQPFGIDQLHQEHYSQIPLSKYGDGIGGSPLFQLTSDLLRGEKIVGGVCTPIVGWKNTPFGKKGITAREVGEMALKNTAGSNSGHLINPADVLADLYDPKEMLRVHDKLAEQIARV